MGYVTCIQHPAWVSVADSDGSGARVSGGPAWKRWDGERTEWTDRPGGMMTAFKSGERNTNLMMKQVLKFLVFLIKLVMI